MTNKKSSFVLVTPFELFRGICRQLLSIDRGMMNHGEQVHPDIAFQSVNVIRAVVIFPTSLDF